MTIEHRDIPNSQLHEPKGISTAAAGTVYTADGNGSGSWEELPGISRASAFPVGTIMPYAGDTEPKGWMFCDGRELSRDTHSGLFFVISTLYGIGNGSTTFNIPDMRGRVPATINQGSNRITTAGSGINGNTAGSSGGSETVSLTSDELPSMSTNTSENGSHTHTLNDNTIVRVTSGTIDMASGGNVGSAAISTQSAGEHTHTVNFNPSSPNNPHSSLMPTIIMNYIIYHGLSD
jgi:microcystin-dependent protein